MVSSTEDFMTGDDRLKSSEKFQGYDLPGGPSFAQLNQTAVYHYNFKKDSVKFKL